MTDPVRAPSASVVANPARSSRIARTAGRQGNDTGAALALPLVAALSNQQEVAWPRTASTSTR